MTLTFPAKGVEALTPSDSVYFSPSIIYSHATGDLVATGEDDVDFTIPVTANTWLPVRVVRVKAATSITVSRLILE